MIPTPQIPRLQRDNFSLWRSSLHDYVTVLNLTQYLDAPQIGTSAAAHTPHVAQVRLIIKNSLSEDVMTKLGDEILTIDPFDMIRHIELAFEENKSPARQRQM